ncbi:MAG: hypothetical protein ABSF69_21860 [Polyangiaceae bacterium]
MHGVLDLLIDGDKGIGISQAMQPQAASNTPGPPDAATQSALARQAAVVFFTDSEEIGHAAALAGLSVMHPSDPRPA